ncbi:MAG: hypothetical protein L0099_06495 [Acidobacteria bacterium]|nr:hypothetical protein [Acidobacteriota bacterium]
MDSLATRAENSVPPERKAYVTPCLQEYGQIEKLTRSGGSSTLDAARTMKVAGT